MLKTIRGSSPAVLVGRLLLAAFVVFATYNPSGTSVYHWVVDNPDPADAWVVLAGIVVVLINIAMLIAAWKALGKLGTVIVIVFFAALAYLSLQEGWVSTDSGESLQWLGLILYSVFLGIGLSGAIIWRRATGQVITDEAPDIER